MTAPVDSALRDRLVDHMVRRIDETEMWRDPFPHLLVRGFLPDDLYGDLIASLPETSRYEAFGYDKHQTAGQSNRGRFRLETATLDALPPGPRRFWYALRHAFGSRALKDAVFHKLAPGLGLRFGEAPERAARRPGFALPELFRETAGYTIAPHPDTRKKVVTMQFALPRDARQESLGTEFYRRSFNPAAWLREPRGFEVVKTMPFLPNTVYAFTVLNTLALKSWHGRTTIASSQGVRDSLLNIWYEKVEHANRQLAEECGLVPPAARAA